MRTRTPRRRAATAAETAVVGSVFFLLLLMIITGAVLVSRYQQVAAVAREGARYASVHGGQYAAENGLPAAPTSVIFANAISPMAVGLNLSASDVTVKLKTWQINDDGSVSQVTQDWDSSDKYPYVVTDSNGTARTTSVVVTVSHTFAPDVLGGTITMTSTSEIPMSY
jgi:Flp pilus assembly protein TadG